MAELAPLGPAALRQHVDSSSARASTSSRAETPSTSGSGDRGIGDGSQRVTNGFIYHKVRRLGPPQRQNGQHTGSASSENAAFGRPPLPPDPLVCPHACRSASLTRWQGWQSSMVSRYVRAARHGEAATCC